jgi:hypothetical protein
LRPPHVFIHRLSVKSHRTQTRIQVTRVPLTQLCTGDEGVSCLLL